MAMDKRPKCMGCGRELKIDQTLTSKLDVANSQEGAVGRSLETSLSSVSPAPYVMITSNLLELIANDQSGVDSPLCRNCADQLTDCLDQRLSKAEENCREYRKVLSKLHSTDQCESVELLQNELTALEAEEDCLKKDLLDFDRLDKELDEKIAIEEENFKQILQKENNLWKMYRDCKRKIQDFDHEIQSSKNQLAYATTALERLSKADVFNVTFRIWHSGPFGVINGFRLGRGPNVDWPEINAAFGQCVLLLYSLIKQVDMQLKGFQLVPFGSYSYIRSLRDGKELRLFADGGTKFTWYPKLDQAIVAFVHCLHQLEEHIRLKMKDDYNLPYKMNEDKLEEGNQEYSVKTHLNSEDRWTKAMKCLLTNMKWALAWVASNA